MTTDTKLRLILEAIWKGQGVKQASADLNRLNKEAQGGAGGLKAAGIAAGVAGGLVSVLTGKVLQAVGAVKDLVVESTLLAARYETMGVVVDNLGRNVGMTTGEMRDLEVALQDTGISVIGSREAIAKLIGAEIDLAKATDLARVAQDAAVIAGENSTAAFQRLINFITTGNIRVARQAGLFVNLKAAYEEWADANDRTVESLTEQEKIMIRTNATIKAGAVIADTYEEAMTTAGKQLGSMERDIDNVKVAFGSLFTEILNEGVPVTRTFLQELTEMANSLNDLQDAMGQAEDDVPLLWEAIREGGPAVFVLKESVKGLWDTFQDIVNGLPFVTEVFSNVSGAIEFYTGGADRATSSSEAFAPALTEVGLVAEKAAIHAMHLANQTSGLDEAFAGGIDVLRNYSREALAAAAMNQLLKESMADGFVDDTEMDRVAALAERFGVDLPANLAATVGSFNQLTAQGIDPAAASADQLFGHLLGVEGVTGDLTARDHRIVYNIDIQGDLDLLQMAAQLGGSDFDFKFSGGGGNSSNTGLNQKTFEEGGGLSIGGVMPNGGKGRIFEVGEGGPEMVINGVVIPTHITKQLKRLGLTAGQGFQGGGFAFDIDTLAQITGSHQTAGSLSFSQQAALTRSTVEAARSGGSRTTVGARSTAGSTDVAQAATAAAVAVEQAVAPGLAQVTATLQAQQAQLLSTGARQLSQAAEQLAALNEILFAIKQQGTSTDFANDVGDSINEVLG